MIESLTEPMIDSLSELLARSVVCTPSLNDVARAASESRSHGYGRQR